MQKDYIREMSFKKVLLAGSGALVIAASTLAITIPVYAIANLSATPAAAGVAASTRLDGAKLKLCTAREKAIDNILTRVANRGNRHLAVIDGIATKTEAFYVKSGKTLSNYDSLVATVNADKTAAQATMDKVKTDSTSFSCNSSDPAAALQLFKNDLKAEITALQDYKTAVKNLIVGVKSVQGTTSSSTNGGSQ